MVKNQDAILNNIGLQLKNAELLKQVREAIAAEENSSEAQIKQDAGKVRQAKSSGRFLGKGRAEKTAKAVSRLKNWRRKSGNVKRNWTHAGEQRPSN